MPLRLALLLVLLCVGCADRTTPQRVEAAREDDFRPLVAAVEVDNAIAIWRDEGAGWNEHRRLPREARALRFSPSGKSVAWMVDKFEGEKPVSRAFAWMKEESAVRELGVMPLEGLDSAPYAVGDTKVVFQLDRTTLSGLAPSPLRGSGPIIDEDDVVFYRTPSGCIARWVSEADEGPKCSPTLRLLRAPPKFLIAADTTSVLFASTLNVVLSERQEGPTSFRTRRVPMDNVLDASIKINPLGFLVIRRIDNRGAVADALEAVDIAGLGGPHDSVHRVMTAPVILSADGELKGNFLAIRRTKRKDIYENMLAHAPYEFGGEAIGGEAIRIRDGKIEPVAGLENRSVRALFRAR